MLNCAAFTGRLTNNPQLMTTQSGVMKCTFSIAVERDFVKPGEDRQADYIDCVVWRNTAEFVSKYFFKGSMIAVSGQIQTHTYLDSNNARRKVTELNVASVSFCGKPEHKTEDVIKADEYNQVEEEDLPF